MSGGWVVCMCCVCGFLVVLFRFVCLWLFMVWWYACGVGWVGGLVRLGCALLVGCLDLLLVGC